MPHKVEFDLLDDVDTAGKSDGDLVYWDATAGRYKTTAPLAAGPVVPWIEEKTDAADTPDDDFTSGTLDGKWTAVTGASGTVSLLETGAAIEKYDLATRSGHLLMQAGTTADKKVQLRQDYTLPDGKSIVCAIAPGTNYISGGGGANIQWAGIGLNDNNAGYDADTSAKTAILMLDSEASLAGYRWLFYDTSATVLGEATVGVGRRTYLRIARSGLDYYAFLSFDGMVWMPLGKKTLSTAATNLWIFAEAVATARTPLPIHAVDWIRLGTNALEPWS